MSISVPEEYADKNLSSKLLGKKGVSLGTVNNHSFSELLFVIHKIDA